VEALLFRGLIALGSMLTLTHQRFAAAGVTVAFSAVVLLMVLAVTSLMVGLGRRLELRLRIALLEKLPRLGDRYFRTRLVSDLAHRSHSIHTIRALPELGAQLVRSAFGLLFTAAGIVWIAPRLAPLAIGGTLVLIALPLLALPALTERDLRVRTIDATLSRFYLDALLGIIPLRTHGGGRNLRRVHEGVLTHRAIAGHGLLRLTIGADGVQAVVGLALALTLLLLTMSRGDNAGALLLLVYWALQLPTLADEIALGIRQLPVHRNVAFRLLEPLTASEEWPRQEGPAPGAMPDQGAALRFESVTVRMAGNTILDEIDLDLSPGTHLAVVGRSGSGKSTLVSLLLGFGRPTEGRLLLDHAVLDEVRVQELRRRTAWVDPTVQLWNRTLLENLLYGVGPGRIGDITPVVTDAELLQLLESLPDGLATPLGESGALVSGGEGQRIRLARALLRRDLRLALLDEPFTGLDRPTRRRLLARLRALWRHATLICVTHDVADTAGFDRVAVMESGRIIEDGTPAELAARAGSRYADLLRGDREAAQAVWDDRTWRRYWLEHGRLQEGNGGPPP
jgi:ATP-binding cassette subfamily B protein